MKRILGLDYGSKTVGAAATDALGITVQPVETIFRKEEKRLRRTLARIEVICSELEIAEIVIGLPLNMDGTEGERAEKAREFGEKVGRRTGLPVYFEDERLTTLEADEILDRTGHAKADRKTVIDQLAAVLILESWLSRKEKENGKDQI